MEHLYSSTYCIYHAMDCVRKRNMCLFHWLVTSRRNKKRTTVLLEEQQNHYCHRNSRVSANVIEYFGRLVNSPFVLPVPVTNFYQRGCNSARHPNRTPPYFGATASSNRASWLKLRRTVAHIQLYTNPKRIRKSTILTLKLL